VPTCCTTPGSTSVPASVVEAPITRSAPTCAASTSSFTSVFCTESAARVRASSGAASASARSLSFAFTASTR
jgi:hypothetical protein